MAELDWILEKLGGRLRNHLTQGLPSGMDFQAQDLARVVGIRRPT